MKLAIVGTGKIVEDVLPVLSEIDGIDLKAILSTPRSIGKAQALVEQFAIEKAFSQFEELLSYPEIDTLYIASPNHLHYQMAKQGLLAGKHVICEKPFTLRLSELEELVRISKEKDLILLEAITNQYLENFHFIKENLKQIGQVKIVECNYSQYSSRYDAFKEGQIAPAFDASKGGGALRDLNIYNIHLVVGLFGQPKDVSYMANMERGVDTSGVLLLDYEEFKVVCIGAKDCEADIRSTIQGNQGSIAVLGATNTLPQVQVAVRGQEPLVLNLNQSEHRMVAEFKAFQEIINQKDVKKVDQALQHSLAVMQVLEKAAESLV
ncbi:Gfo/Idh/MocA family protein [Streptococcus catagoni]|uniref:Gfo/Idh/MocA family protein n=1 Tax=Streptococcus catagoni TaxID=2654874 RepID=UPI00140885DE|nr:Gfo/Idh/MocA family oxidoreductase [Streptococcus catagoni]